MTFATMCPNVNRESSLWAKVGQISGFFLRVLAQNGTFENRNLNTMHAQLVSKNKIYFKVAIYVHKKKVLQNTTAKSHEEEKKTPKKKH